MGVGGPGVVAHFARPRDQVEYPTLHARPNIERSNRSLASESTNNQNVVVGDSRRIGAELRAWELRAWHLSSRCSN